MLMFDVRSGQNMAAVLYSEKEKPHNFEKPTTIKKKKIAKRAHAFKSYTHTTNDEILNSLNPELTQLKK